MNEQAIGFAMLAICVVLYPIIQNSPYIRKVKYVDFSKVFR